MCKYGQNKVFEEASELLFDTLSIDISAMQIQRVCEYYGTAIDEAIERNIEDVIPKLEIKNQNELTYVMIDGSMIPMRKDKWKEVKLARIFRERDIVPISSKRNTICNSVYVSHLGTTDTFFPKLERHLTSYKRKIIIGDGAKWIWNWAEDNYPNAIMILDFYHAKEKLVLFSNANFKDDIKRKEWLEIQTKLLFDGKVEKVMENVKTLKPRYEEAKRQKQKLLSYYLEHEDKMEYDKYREQGFLIGSGPIEAAHRSVLQCRMKLSGQKWSINGANAMANLRCYIKSNAGDLVQKFILAA
jgi:hypothetical protein